MWRNNETVALFCVHSLLADDKCLFSTSRIELLTPDSTYRFPLARTTQRRGAGWHPAGEDQEVGGAQHDADARGSYWIPFLLSIKQSWKKQKSYVLSKMLNRFKDLGCASSYVLCPPKNLVVYDGTDIKFCFVSNKYAVKATRLLPQLILHWWCVNGSAARGSPFYQCQARGWASRKSSLCRCRHRSLAVRVAFTLCVLVSRLDPSCRLPTAWPQTVYHRNEHYQQSETCSLSPVVICFSHMNNNNTKTFSVAQTSLTSYFCHQFPSVKLHTAQLSPT